MPCQTTYFSCLCYNLLKTFQFAFTLKFNVVQKQSLTITLKQTYWCNWTFCKSQLDWKLLYNDAYRFCIHIHVSIYRDCEKAIFWCQRKLILPGKAAKLPSPFVAFITLSNNHLTKEDIIFMEIYMRVVMVINALLFPTGTNKNSMLWMSILTFMSSMALHCPIKILKLSSNITGMKWSLSEC